MINLQKKKQQVHSRRVRLVLLLLLMSGLLSLGTFYWENISSFIAQLFLNGSEETVGVVRKISGLYEGEFTEGERVELVGTRYNQVFTVRSVQQSIVQLGNDSITLSLNTPVQLDIDNDGGLDYLLIMRGRDLDNETLLLRIDPRVHNQNLVRGVEETEQTFPSVDPDAVIRDVLVQQVRTPIILTIEFEEETYYRIRSGDAILAEGNAEPNSKYTDSISGQISVYLSLDAFVRVTVNNTDLELESRNLPLVFDLLWVREQEQEVLKLIPRP